MGAYIYDVDDNFVGSMERNYVYDTRGNLRGCFWNECDVRGICIYGPSNNLVGYFRGGEIRDSQCQTLGFVLSDGSIQDAEFYDVGYLEEKDSNDRLTCGITDGYTPCAGAIAFLLGML